MLLYSSHFFIISNFMNETNNKYFLNKGWKYDVYGDVYEDDYTDFDFIDLCLYETEPVEYVRIENENWSYYPDEIGFQVIRSSFAALDFSIEKDLIADQNINYSNFTFIQDRQYSPSYSDNHDELHRVSGYGDFFDNKLETFESINYINENSNNLVTFPNNNFLYFLDDSFTDRYYDELNYSIKEHLMENDNEINIFATLQWVSGDDDNYEFWYEPFYMHTKTRELHSLEFLDKLNFYKRIKNSEIYQDIRKIIKNSEKYKNTWHRMKNSEIVEFYRYFETHYKVCKSRTYRKFYSKHFIENNVEMKSNYDEYKFEKHYDRSYYTSQSDDWFDAILYEDYYERYNK